MNGTTFGWKDRATYIVANAQLVILAAMVSVGAAILFFAPSIPSVPPIVMGWFAAFLLFGPTLFVVFIKLAGWLRDRNMVTVHHVNGVTDEVQTYFVEPELWREKAVDGPAPYPVNGGESWAVREFENDEDLEQLRVRGVWLEELEDVKLLTKKKQMEEMYDTLVESHIALGIFRDSTTHLASRIQRQLINKSAEARERGTMMDPEAVKEVFEEFENEATSIGPDDLPNIELNGEASIEQLATEAVAEGAGPGAQEAVTDGGGDG